MPGAEGGACFPVRIASMRYPPLCDKARIDGTVVLLVRIGSDGTVLSADSLEGRPLLVKAAGENVKSWKFSKACAAGNAAGHVRLTYVFRLREEANGPSPTDFVFEYPNKVIVTSRAVLFVQP